MIEFEWDEANLNHISRRDLDSRVVEDALQNDPVRLGVEIRNGELRVSYVGEADSGEILVVHVTPRGSKIRVVTAWVANAVLRAHWMYMKRNRNV